MKQIIKDGLIVENSWQHWTESGTTVSDIIGGRRQVIVPLQFLEEHAHRGGPAQLDRNLVFLSEFSAG